MGRSSSSSKSPGHRDGPKLRVSMADVARRAGVHQTTVSLALRDSPKLSRETREELQQLAREMGYRQDPLVRNLMAQVHAGRRQDESPVLACLNPLRDNIFANVPSFADFVQGFSDRAAELGYQVQEIPCGLHSQAIRNLGKHLENRSIKAAFLPLTSSPLLQAHDFTGIALVTLHGNLERPPLHAVGPDHFHNARLATQKLWAAGSRRLCLVIPKGFRVSALYEWFGGMSAEVRQRERSAVAPELFEIGYDEHQLLAKYLRNYHIDGALVYPQEFQPTFQRAGVRIPDDLNYADPALFPGATSSAGIDPQRHQAGAAATDVVVAQIHRGEYGLPAAPRVVLNEGFWIPGSTIR